jgi:hypothetical protein
MKKYLLITLIISCLLMAGVYSVKAYVASSTNYRIQSDSINIGGGLGTTTNYAMQDTVGEIATGVSSSTLYKLKAGYQQMQEIYIAVSAPSDVNMSPAIGGITGGTGNGQAVWTVITDDPAGYSMSIQASTTPALQSGANSFADYTPVASGVPDYAWGIAATDSEFGFTPEGNDIAPKFKNSGTTCNIGSSDAPDACWLNFLTIATTIAQTTAANHPSGTATTVKFKAQSGASHVQEAGTYTAKVSVTAVGL